MISAALWISSIEKLHNIKISLKALRDEASVHATFSSKGKKAPCSQFLNADPINFLEFSGLCTITMNRWLLIYTGQRHTTQRTNSLKSNLLSYDPLQIINYLKERSNLQRNKMFLPAQDQWNRQLTTYNTCSTCRIYRTSRNYCIRRQNIMLWKDFHTSRNPFILLFSMSQPMNQQSENCRHGQSESK